LQAIYASCFLSYEGELSPSSLIAEAEQATGCFDWGGARWAETGFRERLATLCTALETEAQLTPLGRTRAHCRLHAMLCSRVRVVAYHKKQLTDPSIVAPFIGTGSPRSGTSFLQALLAQDPDHIVPITSHGMVPVPPPGILPDESERLQLVSRMLSFLGLDSPVVNAIHPFAPDAEDEDVLFQEAACGSLYQGFFNVPSFAALLHDAATEFYEWQKGMLQLMQHGRPGKRWVLKAPEYMSQLPTLRAIYPDARVFLNHRDLAKVIPSIASLYLTFQSLNSTGAIDPKYLGPPMLTGQMAAINTMMAWRDANPAVPIVDVHYKQLVADPIGVAERLYAAFDLNLSGEAKQCMARFLKVNRHGQKQGSVDHRYTLEDFGLTEAMIDAASESYLARFEVEREART
jgi:hypothetical protein